MRKTLLVLTTMTLALLLAAGVALAATITCKVGVVCNGTSSADTVTGTTSNDTINGLAGNDTIKALDGIDQITGGPNNDTMNGGPGNDTYKFAKNWGADRISADSGGVDTLTFAPHTTAYDSSGAGVRVPLTADGSTLCPSNVNPCLSIQGTFIENLIGTSFNDALSGNTLNNKITGSAGRDNIGGDAGNDTINGGPGGVSGNPENMDGQAGGDTYTGYGSGGIASGRDVISDTGGSTDIDKLNLTKFNLAEVSLDAWPLDGSNIYSLEVTLPDGSQILLSDYFDGSSTGHCAVGPGFGRIESISFADDPNVDFAQLRSMWGCAP
jgi:Ca2+-binding RTX toxin-like protein